MSSGRTKQEIPGSIVLSGVGDKVVCKEGIYKINLPFRKAIMSGLCLDTVIAKFPVYSLGVVGRDINEHCVRFKGEPACNRLPKLPKNVEGQTDIMTGILSTLNIFLKKPIDCRVA